ncbi:MAG: SpoIIE family protein phosphatase, partial [Bacillota bacterium]
SSDGYVDQNGGTEGKRFGRTRFMELLEENYNKSLAQQKKILEEELEEHMGQEEQRDDITVLGFKV